MKTIIAIIILSLTSCADYPINFSVRTNKGSIEYYNKAIVVDIETQFSK